MHVKLCLPEMTRAQSRRIDRDNDDYAQLRFVRVPLSVFIRNILFSHVCHHAPYVVFFNTGVFIFFDLSKPPTEKKVDKNITDIIYMEVNVLLVNTHISYKDKANLCQILEELITRVNQSTNKCSYC